MIHKLIFLFTIIFLFGCVNQPLINQKIVSSDIANFWEAYDKMTSTQDTTLQLQYINELYIDKGTIGLQNIMALKNYTAEGYVDAINKYPKFWNSIRANTLQSKDHQEDIVKSIQKLKAIYPDLSPATIYFTIGILRTNGTIMDSTVLIGSEMSFADKTTIVDELPDWRKPFFTDYNPIEGLELLCTHEYVHTQQTALVDNLLTYCLYEGVAEFVSTKALGVPSEVPAIKFGKDNEAIVKAEFEKDLFIPQRTYNWLWGQNQNELKVRDLGYYIGYSICENYYEKSKDKTLAIKEMIELDFSNEDQIEAFVNTSGFLTDSLNIIYKNFESSIPTVVGIKSLVNGSQDVDPTVKQITLNFSKPMDKENRGFEFGPLGEENVLRVEKVIGFSEDGKSFTIEIGLVPNKQYQTLVSNRFISVDGIPLKPYLIDFKTRVK